MRRISLKIVLRMPRNKEGWCRALLVFGNEVSIVSKYKKNYILRMHCTMPYVVRKTYCILYCIHFTCIS
jgi:hypothetical protein